jgi:hypothetical protein
MTRRAARVDANHAAVVATLQSCGWIVVDCSRTGDGFPDLLVARAGQLLLVEVKDGAKPPSRQRLTAAEAQLHRRLALGGVRVRVVASVAEAVALK